MVSKTKSKTRKKGKQTRVIRKSKPLKKKAVKKTNRPVVRPKRVSARAQRASGRRNRVVQSLEQDNQLLAQENSSSISSVGGNLSDEQEGEQQFTRPDSTPEETTTNESLGLEENITDQSSDTSEIV
jgi:hypothetical protein